MDFKGQGHIILFGCVQKAHQRFKSRVLVMMAMTAGIGLFVDAAFFHAEGGIHESEGMTVCVPGLTDGGNPRHMAGDTASERMNAVSRTILRRRVTAFAKSVLKQAGF